MGENLIYIAASGLIIGIISFFIAKSLAKKAASKEVEDASEKAKQLISDAENRAAIKSKEAFLEAKEERLKLKSEFEVETEATRKELDSLDRNLKDEERTLNKKIELVESREKDVRSSEDNLHAREKGVEIRENELKDIIATQNDKLQKIAQMSPEEAKKQLMENMIGEARIEAASHIKEIRDQAERDANKEAKEIITLAINRCASDHAVETTVSVVNLPGDEMKGRIIGREGRNIRSFETATGVDVIVDDTPEAVILSGFDPVRREVARIALEKLITDGRIHPTRIEEVVEKAREEIEVIIQEAGEQACFDLGIHGLNRDLINMLGKLKYRTSYGQNVLEHSKEVSMLCGLMAAELGLDDAMAKRCALLHDIGKAIDRETEGTHTQIGADFLRRVHEHENVINAAESHHNDVPMISPYSVLVQAADSISGARPGARRESLESYIKRLTKLEEIADSFKGVSKAYAIQAGREIRVIVENDKIDDLASTILAADIAEKIEADMQYPGQIKVTVIRETRSTEYAK